MPDYKSGTFYVRGKTAAEWAATNPVIRPRELVCETDTGKMKLGNGAKYLDTPFKPGADGAKGEPGPPGQDGAMALTLADDSLVNEGTATEPKLKVGDLSGEYASAADLASLSDQLGQLMGIAATTDELTISQTWQGAWNGSTWGKTVSGVVFLPMWTAPYACQITAADLMVMGVVTQDATNYVQLNVRSYTDSATYADAVTKSTADEAIADRVAWSFAGADWDTDKATLAAGATVGLVVVPHGTATLPCPATLTLTVQPT